MTVWAVAVIYAVPYPFGDFDLAPADSSAPELNLAGECACVDRCVDAGSFQSSTHDHIGKSDNPGHPRTSWKLGDDREFMRPLSEEKLPDGRRN